MKENRKITRLDLEKYILDELDASEKKIVEQAIKSDSRLQAQLDHIRQQIAVFKTRYPTFKHLQDTRTSQRGIPAEEEDSVLLIDSNAGKLVLISAVVIILIAIISFLFTFETAASDDTEITNLEKVIWHHSIYLS
jgi:anti-sigma-K factor RskA